jgi:hypothetical protein
MKCSRCHSQDIRRSARRGFLDNLRASMGRWPFRCQACGRCFYANRRYIPAPAKSAPGPNAATYAHAKGGPEMAFRRDETRPMAKVVIQADDQAQLDRILLALHSAVSSYQYSSSDYSTRTTR